MEIIVNNKKSAERDKLIEALSIFVGTSNLSRRQAHKKSACCKCGGDAKKFKDSVSVKEYSITGWCQTCQDDFYRI